MAQLSVGDLVIRRHRRLKTRGAIVRVVVQRRGEARQVWVKWDHPDTLPNPSLEDADNLELIQRPDQAGAPDILEDRPRPTDGPPGRHDIPSAPEPPEDPPRLG
jgi:hypothetical protein